MYERRHRQISYIDKVWETNRGKYIQRDLEHMEYTETVQRYDRDQVEYSLRETEKWYSDKDNEYDKSKKKKIIYKKFERVE